MQPFQGCRARAEPLTQGRSPSRPTLGWKIQSLRDWSHTAARFRTRELAPNRTIPKGFGSFSPRVASLRATLGDQVEACFPTLKGLHLRHTTLPYTHATISRENPGPYGVLDEGSPSIPARPRVARRIAPLYRWHFIELGLSAADCRWHRGPHSLPLRIIPHMHRGGHGGTDTVHFQSARRKSKPCETTLSDRKSTTDGFRSRTSSALY
jgi:hypothetical protein